MFSSVTGPGLPAASPAPSESVAAIQTIAFAKTGTRFVPVR
jgi:hypothetical protein